VSDYLLRLVERAVGSSAGQSPRPQRRFDWGSPWTDAGSVDLESPIGSSFRREPIASRRTPQQVGAYPISPDADGSFPLVTEGFDDYSRERVRAAHDDPGRTAGLKRDFVPTSSVESGVSESARPPAASRADKLDRSELEASEPGAKQLSLGTEVSTIFSANSSGFESTKVEERGIFHTAENRTIGTESPRSEAEEPIVEVSIGRVEVKLDAPIPPAALKAAVRPAGFAEFEALRRYTAGSWPSRRR
jgi:hypothetical protein